MWIVVWSILIQPVCHIKIIELVSLEKAQYCYGYVYALYQNVPLYVFSSSIRELNRGVPNVTEVYTENVCGLQLWSRWVPMHVYWNPHIMHSLISCSVSVIPRQQCVSLLNPIFIQTLNGGSTEIVMLVCCLSHLFSFRERHVSLGPGSSEMEPRPVTDVGPSPHSKSHMNIYKQLQNGIFCQMNIESRRPRIISQQFRWTGFPH